jgi:uncharacterized protein (DUF1015 family)
MTPPARPTAIRPFRALHYSGQRVRLEDVVAPPYDVISGDDRERLLARSPYNVVRLILPDEGTERGVNRLFCAWQREHVVVQDPLPCLYRVEQDFVGPDGIARTRSGFIALVKLEPYEARVVRPHERTYAGPKEGRLRLLRATRTQLSPVFALYDDPAGRAETALLEGSEPEPEIDVTDAQGTRHRLWRVPANHEAVTEVVAAGPLLIADGHHRYETALAYMAEREGQDDAPAEWTMMYLANAASPGLQIYPTHRIVLGVPAAARDALPGALEGLGFRVEARPGDDPPALVRTLDAAGEHPAAVVWRPGAEPLLVRLADGRGALEDLPPPLARLDVTAVDRLVLGDALGLGPDAPDRAERIAYRHRAADAVALAEQQGDAVAVLLRAPDVHDVAAVADAGEVMPQKSTFFYPKTVDGFVFYGLDA